MKNERLDPASCDKHQAIQEYSHLQEFINNLPYLVMVVLGTIIFHIGFERGFWSWGAAGLYFLYGIVGAFWIIICVCPYCHYFGTSSCPCGYGQISAALLNRKDDSLFSKKFKKHIPVIVPLWVAPAIAGVIFLAVDFSPLMLALLAAFVLDSFLILPLTSTKHGCTHCPQRDECPWMSRRSGKDGTNKDHA